MNNIQCDQRSKEVIRTGHYVGEAARLLKEFDRISAALMDWLVDRHGKSTASALQKAARREFESLIPEIPWTKGFRAQLFNRFLLITAQELAVYRAMKGLGRPAAEAWEVCHRALRLQFSRIPRWKKRLFRQMFFSRFAKRIVRRRATNRAAGRIGDFDVEYLADPGDGFDIGINFHRCGNHRFVVEHGGEEFAPYVCMTDIAMSEELGWGLTRTRTLGDGCDHCDFRFSKGGPTSISSGVPEVQQTIERIQKNEGGARYEHVGRTNKTTEVEAE